MPRQLRNTIHLLPIVQLDIEIVHVDANGADVVNVTHEVASGVSVIWRDADLRELRLRLRVELVRQELLLLLVTTLRLKASTHRMVVEIVECEVHELGIATGALIRILLSDLLQAVVEEGLSDEQICRAVPSPILLAMCSLELAHVFVAHLVHWRDSVLLEQRIQRGLLLHPVIHLCLLDLRAAATSARVDCLNTLLVNSHLQET